MAAKSMGDKAVAQDVCSDKDAAACLAQGHPKSKVPPVGFGMKDRSKDSLGARDTGYPDKM